LADGPGGSPPAPDLRIATIQSRGFVKNLDLHRLVERKMLDVQRFEMTPHPVEYEMYYSYWAIPASHARSRDARRQNKRA
jgi:hypothetical protein